jgi:hypothetical protein
MSEVSLPVLFYSHFRTLSSRRRVVSHCIQLSKIRVDGLFQWSDKIVRELASFVPSIRPKDRNTCDVSVSISRREADFTSIIARCSAIPTLDIL